MCKKRFFSLRKGTAIVAAYAVLAALMIVGAGLSRRTVQEVSDVSRYQRSERAFWAAEAGIEQAVFGVKNNAWDMWTVSGDLRTTGLTHVRSEDLAQGCYDVSVDKYGWSTVTVTSTGYFPNRMSPERISRKIRIVLRRNTAFDYAAFGKYDLDAVNLSRTDSYNSTFGDYDLVSNINDEGDIGTNGAVLTLANSAVVNGSPCVPASGTIEVSNSASYTGMPSYEADEKLPPPEVPEELASLSKSSAMKLNSGVTTFAPGDYHISGLDLKGGSQLVLKDGVRLYVSGPIDISGSAGIVVTGNVELYVDGNVKAGGNGIINTTRVPADLKIIGTGDSNQSFDMAGTSDLYAAIYAPEAIFSTTGSANLYGAVTAGKVALGGGEVHFDEALRALTVVDDGYWRTVWEEV
jgi:hypothetical protein